jgi:hypothetical protein
MRTFTAVVCVLGTLALAGAARGNTLHVPSQYLTIQQAVNAANSGDEILIAPGNYADATHMANPPDDTTLCVVIMRPNITLTGSGIGVTFIDGDSTGRGIYLRRCPGVEIRNLTVHRAFAQDHGAAIYCYDYSSPYIHDVEITGNYDGGIAMTAGDMGGCHPRIENCLMTDNEAKSGGGLDVEPGCEPDISNCQIVGNRAPFAAGARLRGSATLRNCIINDNHTTSATNVLAGGVLIKDQADPLLIYCDISGNSVYGDGAGVCFEDAHGELVRCTITGNTAIGLESRGGGITVLSGATPHITGCLVAGNTTTGGFSDGGGMWVQYASLVMESTTFYGNSTHGIQPDYGNAGGIGMGTSMFNPGIITISRCIVAGSTLGGGMYLMGTGDPPQIDCCDVWSNAGGNSIPVSGTGNFSLDPLFCNVGQGDYHLFAASPCMPGNHPSGPGSCGGLGIGAYGNGCGATSVEDPVEASVLALHNVPNPFTGRTTIAFELPREAGVSLEVYDLAGRQVALLYEGTLAAGPHQIDWTGLRADGERAAGGVYFYQLRIGDVVAGRRMLCLR